MHHRGLKVALVAVFTLVLVLGLAGIASAAEWPDLSLSTLGDYGITEAQVAQISDGYTDGTWKPYANMPRKQFVKMAVDAYQIPLVNPATPSYSDVSASHDYYEYVEAATAAGLTNGVGGGKFDPESTITREQAAAIIARWVAAKNGYDLATMYSAAEITEILGGFGDGASVSSSLKAEMAFAVDFGIVWGDATGNLAPLKAVTRIQGAAMLIRSWSIIPEVPEEPGEPPVVPVVPAKVELMSDDEAENLIGLTHQYTFEVTQADGSAAPGVLVDFDTLTDAWYVGNIQPAAALTDADGMVTVNLISTEIGIQRVSAAVLGVSAIWSTKYWLALDEVYILDDTREAENNAGDSHTWEARVVVFGPGPLSTDRQDFYNVLDPDADPSRVFPEDGEPWSLGDYADELALPAPYVPRTMEGIPVLWSITDGTADITAAEFDADIEADGQSAWAYTDADGFTSVTLDSEVANSATVTVEANYEGNPYEWLLVNRSIYRDVDDYWDADEDWEPQPSDEATAVKTWIPHVIGGGEEGPITPAYAVNNTGEVELFTLALEDVFGNVIPGYTVEWWIQGVGQFKTDGSTWSGIGEQNKDVDLTDANGKASVLVKSLVPGQTILHVKVMDKYGLPYKEWNVVKQWYSVDDVMLGEPDDEGLFDDTVTNEVNTSHTWTVEVSGAKYVYTMYDLNDNGLRDDKVLIGDRADMKAIAGVYANFDGSIGAAKAENVDVAVGIPFRPAGSAAWYVRFADMDLADSEFFVDRIGTVQRAPDDVAEVWSVLEGKGVNFFTNIGGDTTSPYNSTDPSLTTITSNTALPTIVAAPAVVQRVGSITGFAPAWVNRTVGGTVYDYDAVTDANGQATVTINSTVKGMQYVWAVVDYPENPQNGNAALPLSWNELRYDLAIKTWTPDTTTPSIQVFANAAAPFATGDVWVNPVLAFDGYSFTVDGLVTIAAPPAGTAADATTSVTNGVVTAINGLPSGAGYTASDVGRAVTFAAPTTTQATASAGALGAGGVLVQGNITFAAGAGYSSAPLVTITANGPYSVAATATATVANGAVTGITLVNAGSGYTVAPTITIGAPNPTTATGTISAVVGGQVTAITYSGGSGYTAAPSITIPIPLKTAATATATVANGAIASVAVDTPGAGYSAAPAVTFSGGFGATATAVLSNAGVGPTVASVTVNNGGSGYGGAGLQASGIADDANPNREVIAVQIFDQYGNALPDYFVTWEILDQGTTTPGTIDTYHPYAHFMNEDADTGDAIYDPAHDDPTPATDPGIVAVETAGTGDRQPHVDSNPIWDNGAAPYGDADDDWAWGWTLNGQINNTLDLASAAHVTLVLDETAGQLAGEDHITSIVNIQVYSPTGVFMEDFEVTKEWTLTAPVLTTIELRQSVDGGTYGSALITDLDGDVYYRATFLDQFGNPMANFTLPANDKLFLDCDVLGQDQIVPIGTAATNGSGFVFYNTVELLPGSYTATYWVDVDGDNTVDTGELKSNSVVANVVYTLVQ